MKKIAVQRTEKALAEALIAVSLEKGYDLVTVMDITDQANVSYSTFFRHYGDKDELLLKMLESVITTLREQTSQYVDASAAASGQIIFQHIQENHRFYRVLFSSLASSRVLDEIQTEIEKIVLATASIRPDTVIPPEIAANHLVTSIFSLIRWWLEHDLPYPVERMAVIYDELIIKSVERVALKPG